ncbi:putative Serine/Threonine kinase domain protein [Blattamonas nauphoetae]|uniref:non-specific serine/threonine protein kinase n=1 Tax=Blattamonas nauphoetae TaxID=2049346 RepID=A0ABQ9YJD8_9EUKA|nr:putative Serine/Threonine kinase domain protein [Blattamonas nauphoetae]
MIDDYQPVYTQLVDDENELGKGANGTVKLVKEEKSNIKYAQKTIHLEKTDMLKGIRKAEDEYHFLSMVRSDHATRLFDTIVDQDGSLSLIITYCENNSLVSISHLLFSETRMWLLISQMCLALVDLDELGIIHLDIKPANIFSQPTGEFILGDFGEAKRLPFRRPFKFDSSGTPGFQAPEQVDADFCSNQTDLYCLGVSLLHPIASNRLLLADVIKVKKETASLRYSLYLRSLVLWLCEDKLPHRATLTDLMVAVHMSEVEPASFSALTRLRVVSKQTFHADVFEAPALAVKALESGNEADIVFVLVQIVSALRYEKKYHRRANVSELQLSSKWDRLLTTQFFSALLHVLNQESEQNKCQCEHMKQVMAVETQKENDVLNFTATKHYLQNMIQEYAEKPGNSSIFLGCKSNEEKESQLQDELEDIKELERDAINHRRAIRRKKNLECEVDARIAVRLEVSRILRISAENEVRQAHYQEKLRSREEQQQLSAGLSSGQSTDEDLLLSLSSPLTDHVSQESKKTPKPYTKDDLRRDENQSLSDLVMFILKTIAQMATPQQLTTMMDSGLASFVFSFLNLPPVPSTVSRSSSQDSLLNSQPKLSNSGLGIQPRLDRPLSAKLNAQPTIVAIPRLSTSPAPGPLSFQPELTLNIAPRMPVQPVPPTVSPSSSQDSLLNSQPKLSNSGLGIQPRFDRPISAKLATQPTIASITRVSTSPAPGPLSFQPELTLNIAPRMSVHDRSPARNQREISQPLLSPEMTRKRPARSSSPVQYGRGVSQQSFRSSVNPRKSISPEPIALNEKQLVEDADAGGMQFRMGFKEEEQKLRRSMFDVLIAVAGRGVAHVNKRLAMQPVALSPHQLLDPSSLLLTLSPHLSLDSSQLNQIFAEALSKHSPLVTTAVPQKFTAAIRARLVLALLGLLENHDLSVIGPHRQALKTAVEIVLSQTTNGYEGSEEVEAFLKRRKLD